MSLSYYLEKFKKLNMNKTGGKTSPHKVCMLYAVIDLIIDGQITNNSIRYDQALKNRFSWHFKRLKSGNQNDRPEYPYYYLISEGFWHHAVRPGQESIYRSLSNGVSERKIIDAIDYVQLDAGLFQLLENKRFALQLKTALATNLDSHEDSFALWARSVGKSEKTVRNYIGALKNSIPNWLSNHDLCHQDIFSITSVIELEKLIYGANQVKEYAEYNSRGNGMYSAALKLYQNYIDDLNQESLKADIEAIETDENLDSTMRQSLITTRRGQGKYRERLIQYWQGCAVTGYSNIRLLVASHIKPWRESTNSERLDPYNGLLLTANLDKAFDLNFITFSTDGKILISDELGDYQLLGIHPDMKVPLEKHHQEFMEFHRGNFRS